MPETGRKSIYFVAGEASADNHGAALMHSLRELNPNLVFTGRGGPQMKAEAGVEMHDWIADAAVVGLWEVVRKYGYFKREFDDALREISERKPDAVVLIDYPGFNLRLARALQKGRLTKKLIYYISPQVWAWNRGRIKQMARHLDLMLCIFPFEADLYNRSGLRTKFVGHPMIDRLGKRKIDASRDENLVGLFPGSRLREVEKIFPILVETARELQRRQPLLHFEIAASSDELARLMEPSLDRQTMKITIGEAAGLMQRAFVGIVASGSATLEAAYFRLPFVLVYKVSWATYLVARSIVAVDYLGMPNVMAGHEVVPEFIQHKATPRKLADALMRLVNDKDARGKMVSEFGTIIDSLGHGGASRQAAAAILQELG